MKIGDVLNYSTAGVCKIEDIRSENVLGKNVEYYVLTTVAGPKITTLIPRQNASLTSKMRPLLSPDDINALITTFPQLSQVWTDDDKMRQEEFKQILDSGSPAQLAAMIKSLYIHKEMLAKIGKALHVPDNTMLKKAQAKLFEEFAYVLGINESEVIGYIKTALSNS